MYEGERRAYGAYIKAREEHSRRPSLVNRALFSWRRLSRRLEKEASRTEVRDMLERRGVKNGKETT